MPYSRIGQVVSGPLTGGTDFNLYSIHYAILILIRSTLYLPIAGCAAVWSTHWTAVRAALRTAYFTANKPHRTAYWTAHTAAHRAAHLQALYSYRATHRTAYRATYWPAIRYTVVSPLLACHTSHILSRHR